MECVQHREPWNKGILVGQKLPLKTKDIWAIRYQLQNAHQVGDLAMFNLHVRDISHGNQILARVMVVQQDSSVGYRHRA
jgi:hypothetical protein